MKDLLISCAAPSPLQMAKKGGTMRSMGLSKCISGRSLPDGQDQCILEGWGSPQMGLLTLSTHIPWPLSTGPKPHAHPAHPARRDLTFVSS